MLNDYCHNGFSVFLQKWTRATDLLYDGLSFFLGSQNSKFAYYTSTELRCLSRVHYPIASELVLTAVYNIDPLKLIENTTSIFLFLFLNRSNYWRWCGTRLQQKNYKAVYIYISDTLSVVQEKCICFIVLVHIMPCYSYELHIALGPLSNCPLFHIYWPCSSVFVQHLSQACRSLNSMCKILQYNQ